MNHERQSPKSRAPPPGKTSHHPKESPKPALLFDIAGKLECNRAASASRPVRRRRFPAETSAEGRQTL